MAQDNATFVRQWLNHYNDHPHDPEWIDKAVADLDANSQHMNHATGRRQHGPQGLRDLVTFFAEAFPGSRVDVTNVFATNDQAVIEFTGRGTNTGPLRLPGGDVPPTGKDAELQFVHVFKINPAGKITSFSTYYDQLDMLRQLGLR